MQVNHERLSQTSVKTDRENDNGAPGILNAKFPTGGDDERLYIQYW